MSYGWVKEFCDGNFEYGWDEDVKNKKASWTRGALYGIKRVYLYTKHGGFVLDAGEGEYLQVDGLSAAFPGTSATMLATFVNRRIAKRIRDEDVGKRLYRHKHNDCAWYTMEFTDKEIGAPIKDKVAGRWLVIEVDMKTGEPLCQIRDKV